MSLIKCFECQREISELAGNCPGCGAPVPSELNLHLHWVVEYRWLSGVLIFVPMIWLAMGVYLDGSAGFAKDFAWAKWVMLAGLVYYVISEIVRNLAESAMKKKRRNQPPSG
jgi:hypothetical protein